MIWYMASKNHQWFTAEFWGCENDQFLPSGHHTRPNLQKKGRHSRHMPLYIYIYIVIYYYHNPHSHLSKVYFDGVSMDFTMI